MLKTFATTAAFGFLVSASALSWNALADSNSFSKLGLGSSLNPNESYSRMQEALKAISSDGVLSRLSQNGLRGLSLSQRVSTEAVETTKFQDFYQGIEVFGSMAFHHRAKDGSFEIRDLLARFDLSVKPSLSAKSAVSVARAAAGDRILHQAPALKILPGDDGSAKLIYWVKLRGLGRGAGRGVAVDAHSGEVIANVSDHLTIAPVDVYSAKGQGVEITQAELAALLADPVDLEDAMKKKAREQELLAACQVVIKESGNALLVNLGACKRTAAAGKAKRGADKSSRNALNNAKSVLEYYLEVHGRDSIDGKGGASRSVVHVGTDFANAYWNPMEGYMAYGDGDGVVMGELTNALDVSGHEHTHGVMLAALGIKSDEVGLTAFGEPGALHEATADFFGKAITNDGDWALGRKIFKDPNAKGIRNMEKPETIVAISVRGVDGKKVDLPYPNHMDKRFPAQETCDDSNDMCWAHINSTVFSHGLYLVQKQVGMEKTEQMYYLAMTQYMNPRANFRSARDATIAACGTLYDTETCDAVKAGFAGVGL